MMFRLLRLCGVLVVPAALTSCSDRNPTAAREPAAQVTITPATAELQLGDSVGLSAVVTDASGRELTGRQIDWSSSNPAVLRVSAGGMVVGVAAGQATVSAQSEGRSASAAITVHPWNIASNVVVIDSTVLRLISDSADQAAGRLRFQVAGSAPDVPPGVVIVGTQSGGFLRRVTAATAAGGELVLQTQPAALADIIEAGEFSTSLDVLFAPGASSTAFGAAVASVRPGQVIWGPGRFTHLAPGMRAVASGFDISGLDVCELLKIGEAAGGSACPDGIEELKITSGRLDFAPDIELSAQFSGFELTQFRGVAKGSLDLDVGLLLKAEGSVEYEAKPKFFTFTRPFLTAIGPVPIIGYVELSVSAKLTVGLSAKGSMEIGLDASSNVELGAQWAGEWTTISQNNGQFTPRTPSVEEGTLSAAIEVGAKVALTPRFQVIFYGVVGPFAEVEPYGSATLSFGTTCGFAVKTGLDAAVGFTIPFLDSSVADFAHEWEPLVAGAEAEWPCPLGSIAVTTTTTGQEPDPDGYSLVLDGEPRAELGPGDHHVLEFVEVGERRIVLTGVASNCTVQGGAERTVDVSVATTAEVAFVIECTALTGSLEVTTSTGGGEPDTDGYTISVDGAAMGTIGSNDTVVFDSLPAGSRSVALLGVAPNCVVQSGNPRQVTLTAGNTTALAFDVVCAATEVAVRVVTEGTPPAGSVWTVTFDGSQTRPITPSGSAVFSTTPGSYTVELTGLPENCAVQSSNPATVSAAEGQSAELIFEVRCTSDALTVTVSTEGDPAPAAAFTVFAGDRSESVAPGGTVTLGGLPTGSTSVRLDGVPEHCTVQGLNPRTVSVPGSTTFDVVCQAPAECTDAPEPTLDERIGHHPGQGGTWSAKILAKSFGLLSATATSTAPVFEFDGYIGPGVTVELESLDHISLVPIDPERVGERAVLWIDVSGEIEVGGSGDPDKIDVHSHFSVTGTGGSFSDERRYDPHGPGTWTTSDRIGVVVTLGEWSSLRSYLAVNVGPGMDGATSLSTASVRIDGFVEARDLQNRIVPIASVCSAGGVSY